MPLIYIKERNVWTKAGNGTLDKWTRWRSHLTTDRLDGKIKIRRSSKKTNFYLNANEKKNPAEFNQNPYTGALTLFWRKPSSLKAISSTRHSDERRFPYLLAPSSFHRRFWAANLSCPCSWCHPPIVSGTWCKVWRLPGRLAPSCVPLPKSFLLLFIHYNFVGCSRLDFSPLTWLMDSHNC